jgi:two-component system, OmpR family, sensor kinase
VRSLGDAADIRRTSRRLGFQTGLLVVGCLVVVVSLLFLLYQRAASSATDQLLADTIAHIDKPSEAPPGVEVTIVSPKGRLVSPGMPDDFPDQKALAAVSRDGLTRQFDVDASGHNYTVRTSKVGDNVVQAVLDRQGIEEERERILTSLLIASGVGVLLAGLVAAWLARRTVRPMADTIAMQRRFVADASHELRTPLTLLSTRAQLLARKMHKHQAGTGELVGDVDGVVADTKVLTEILDDLLVAADTRATAAKEPVDLRRIAHEAVGSATASAERAGVSLVLDDGPAVVVDGTPASLRRAVTALIDNALSHADSRVDVSVQGYGREVRLVVADDGPGIPAEIAPRLFDRFTSSREPASPAQTQGRRHYGLGLALVADVAAVHDGRVTAGARIDGAQGAMVTLALPTHQGSARSPRRR